MYVLNVRKIKKLIIPTIILTIILFYVMCVKSLGMTHYQEPGFVTGLVTADTLNVRQGPSIKYKAVTQVYRNQYIRVFAKIGDWYVIQTENDMIGTVNAKYIKAIYPGQGSNTQQSQSNNSQLTKDEKEVFELINKQRANNGLQALVIDSELQNVARIKAKEMVDKGYFSHTSPTYGSPFDMMKSFKISYQTAGENIAGNSSNSAAVEAWMNSPGHKANILNAKYNYTGIGVVKSPKYGNIYVQMFIGR